MQVIGRALGIIPVCDWKGQCHSTSIDCNERYVSPFQASIFGRAQIADLLIRSGASVSALTERRQSCLHLLAHQSAERFVETAHVLMQHNCNPNTLDDDGLAPLHRASVEMVKALTSVCLLLWAANSDK